MKIKSLIRKYNGMSVQMRATIWFVLCSFIQRGISFIVTPIFTRIMSVSEFGQFNEFLSWQSILTVIVTLNLPWGVFEQGLVKFEDYKDQFTSAIEGLLLFLVIIWILIYLPFQEYFNSLFSLSSNQMLALFILMWTSSIFSFWSATERLDYNYIRIVVLTVIVSVLKPLLGIIFVLTYDKAVDARIWSIVLVEAVCYIGLFFEHVKKGGVLISRKIWKYALKFNIVLIPHYLSQTVLNSSDKIMIGKMVGSDASGIYSLAYSLSLILTVLNTSLLQALNPLIYRKIKEEKFNEIAKYTLPSLLMVGCLNMLLMLLAPEVISIFAPSSYSEAVWIIPPVSMSVFFMYMYSLFATFEFYYEKTKFMSLATTIGAILNVFLNYIFIGWFGYIAAGYTTLVCYILYAICHYMVMRYNCLKNKYQVYNLHTLLLLSFFFISVSTVILLSYISPLLRYMMIIMTIVLLLIFRNKIYSLCRDLIILKK